MFDDVLMICFVRLSTLAHMNLATRETEALTETVKSIKLTLASDPPAIALIFKSARSFMKKVYGEQVARRFYLRHSPILVVTASQSSVVEVTANH
jgi:hypothetical protein